MCTAYRRARKAPSAVDDTDLWVKDRRVIPNPLTPVRAESRVNPTATCAAARSDRSD